MARAPDRPRDCVHRLPRGSPAFSMPAQEAAEGLHQGAEQEPPRQSEDVCSVPKSCHNDLHGPSTSLIGNRDASLDARGDADKAETKQPSAASTEGQSLR